MYIDFLFVLIYIKSKLENKIENIETLKMDHFFKTN